MAAVEREPMTCCNLVELAERKMLPHFQRMDERTLCWIRSSAPTRPELAHRIGVARLIRRVKTWPMETSWFLEPKTIDGLHGIRHALRVAVHAQLLAERYGLSCHIQHLLVTAALLHDVRRIDDRGDPRHGAQCAEWISSIKDLECLVAFSGEERDLICSAVSRHDVTPEDAGSERMAGMLIEGLLKTADALDRYRLPKRSWWIDGSRLRIQPTEDLKAFAFDLVVASECHFLAGAGSFSAVIDALCELKTRYER